MEGTEGILQQNDRVRFQNLETFCGVLRPSLEMTASNSLIIGRGDWI